MKNLSYRTKILGLLALFLLFAAGSVVLFVLENGKKDEPKNNEVSQIEIDALNQANDLYANRVKKAKTAKAKIDAQLAQASFYYSSGKYEASIVVLKSVDTAKMSDAQAASYYAAYAQGAIKLRDFDTAEQQIGLLLSTNVIKNDTQASKLWSDALNSVRDDRDPFIQKASEENES